MDIDQLITAALDSETIAVVGCSSTPGKDAHDVPSYLDSNGYDVIPVNPYADEILGRKAYDSLTDVPHEVDLVDVFRPSEEVSGIVDSVLERDDVEFLWLQLGISDDDAVTRAREAGIDVVQDRCLKVEHVRRQ
ncbi:CoA-binding protein [Natranaeroarchaeum aerophilus]|uniref:CoA-binding protein n=1 Tax=Natranaeroarchaeum aerophilus TaxID=2917711 RepID=A0AAE3K522_9EURY|nr:CoA-binding protein [Natranaeroarchaeum aerophilus]MCL9813972.1 CoA-binding protein [Natranaeroarchaeum aerophilus]